jgi:anti-sigma B factor antagonist
VGDPSPGRVNVPSGVVETGTPSRPTGIVRSVSPTVPWSVVEVRPGEFEVAGEIDAHSAPSLAELLTVNGEKLVLDLAGVTFMDSSGLRVVVNLHQHGQDGGPELVIQDPSKPVVRLFEIAGLTELLAIRQS